MRDIEVSRKEENGRVTLTFRFKSIGQLIDPDDPSSLPDTELTELAKETIAGYIDEYRVKKPMSLVISLPAGEIQADGSRLIPEAIRRNFAFHIQDIMHDLVLSRREGIYSLVIAIGNAFVAILFLYLVSSAEIPLESFPTVLIAGFITILNWVTIWDTYEHFVFDYRDLLRKRRLYEKLSRIPISVKEY
jgi:hypothetical protein